MKVPILLTLILFGFVASAKNKPKANVEKLKIDHEGKIIKARKLCVSSKIPMPIEAAWDNVKTPALLEFVSKGMIRFKPTDDPLPIYWKNGETYSVKMRIFGFIPFGGKHYLYINEVNENSFVISTKEWDKRAKIWNHTIKLKDLGNEMIYYEDSIVIYGGLLTGVITSFARMFYKHRQKRWQIVAEKRLKFGEE